LWPDDGVWYSAVVKELKVDQLWAKVGPSPACADPPEQHSKEACSDLHNHHSDPRTLADPDWPWRQVEYTLTYETEEMELQELLDSGDIAVGALMP